MSKRKQEDAELENDRDAKRRKIAPTSNQLLLCKYCLDVLKEPKFVACPNFIFFCLDYWIVCTLYAQNAAKKLLHNTRKLLVPFVITT